MARNAGRLDVDRMLASVTPEQFDEWVAMDSIERDPLERIREVLKIGFCTLAAANGMKTTPDQLDPVKPERDADEVTPAQAAAAVKAAHNL